MQETLIDYLLFLPHSEPLLGGGVDVIGQNEMMVIDTDYSLGHYWTHDVFLVDEI